MTGPVVITPAIHLRRGETSAGLPIITAEVELNSFDSAVPLPAGDDGDRGPIGDYQPPLTFRAFITDDADLPDDLDPEHTGWTYANTTTRDVHVWDGGAWLVFTGVLAEDGPVGPGNTLAVTSSDSVVPASGGASLTGSSPQQMHITLPLGDKGADGPPGPREPIRTSEDYTEPEEGPLPQQVLGYTGIFTPLDPSTLRGVYSLPEAAFTEVATAADDEWRLVAQITLPAQPWPWRPLVFGGVLVDANSGTSVSSWTRCDMEVRIGTDDGQIVALGTGINSYRDIMCRATPHFDAEIVPESYIGSVQAGESVTLVVVLRRIFGPREWAHMRGRGSLMVYMSPV